MRGVTASHEAIRLGVSQIRSRLCSKPAPPACQLGDVWHLDEVFITIRGRRRNLWKAVGQDGDDLDIAGRAPPSRECRQALFSKLLKGSPWQLVSDKLRSYAAARRELSPSATFRTGQYENNGAEVSRQHTSERERQTRRFKSAAQARRGLAVRAAAHDAFRRARHRF